MTMIYPNIVPENNLRLPDALTIKHGPAPLLSKFVLEGDKLARRMGIRLKLCYDFGELVYVNKTEMARGHWYRLVDIFNPEYCDLTPENSYWISGENEYGEIVVTQAGRIYYWPDTTLEQEARMMFYGDREVGQKCSVTAADASMITGVVFFGGSVWVRPDFRGKQLSQLLPRLGRAYAVARWPVNWGISFVNRVLVEKGVASGYGYKHTSYSILYPGSPLGDLDLALVSISSREAYDDFSEVLAKFSGSSDTKALTLASTSFSDTSVTKTSRVGVFQGSNSLS